jgi:hypothetical protein
MKDRNDTNHPTKSTLEMMEWRPAQIQSDSCGSQLVDALEEVIQLTCKVNQEDIVSSVQ